MAGPERDTVILSCRIEMDEPYTSLRDRVELEGLRCLWDPRGFLIIAERTNAAGSVYGSSVKALVDEHAWWIETWGGVHYRLRLEAVSVEDVAHLGVAMVHAQAERKTAAVKKVERDILRHGGERMDHDTFLMLNRDQVICNLLRALWQAQQQQLVMSGHFAKTLDELSDADIGWHELPPSYHLTMINEEYGWRAMVCSDESGKRFEISHEGRIKLY